MKKVVVPGHVSIVAAVFGIALADAKALLAVTQNVDSDVERREVLKHNVGKAAGAATLYCRVEELHAELCRVEAQYTACSRSTDGALGGELALVRSRQIYLGRAILEHANQRGERNSQHRVEIYSHMFSDIRRRIYALILHSTQGSEHTDSAGPCDGGTPFISTDVEVREIFAVSKKRTVGGLMQRVVQPLWEICHRVEALKRKSMTDVQLRRCLYRLLLSGPDLSASAAVAEEEESWAIIEEEMLSAEIRWAAYVSRLLLRACHLSEWGSDSSHLFATVNEVRCLTFSFIVMTLLVGYGRARREKVEPTHPIDSIGAIKVSSGDGIGRAIDCVSCREVYLWSAVQLSVLHFNYAVEAVEYECHRTSFCSQAGSSSTKCCPGLIPSKYPCSFLQFEMFIFLVRLTLSSCATSAGTTGASETSFTASVIVDSLADNILSYVANREVSLSAVQLILEKSVFIHEKVFVTYSS